MQAELTTVNPLINILRAENESLKTGLSNIQDNLAGAVARNTQNIGRCRKIEEGCRALSSNTQTIDGEAQEFAAALAEISSLVEANNRQVHDTEAMNQQSTQQIVEANDSVFMSLAKIDHVLWKVNTYLTVIDERPCFEYVDHHHCRLGKWYETGDGYQSFAQPRNYKSLPQPHAAVHEATHEIFCMLGDGISNDDPRVQQAIGRMEEGSTSVFSCLDRMLEEKHG